MVAVDLVTGSVQAVASTALLPGLSASSAVVASPATLAAMVDEELGTKKRIPESVASLQSSIIFSAVVVGGWIRRRSPH